MKVPGPIDGAFRGAIVPSRSLAFSDYLGNLGGRYRSYGTQHGTQGTRPFPHARADGDASTSRSTAAPRSSRTENVTHTDQPEFRTLPFFRPSAISVRDKHHVGASSVDEVALPSSRRYSRRELLALVEPEGAAGTVDEHLRYLNDPYHRGYAPSDGPNMVVATHEGDLNFPSGRQVMRLNAEEQHTLLELQSSVTLRLRSPLKVDLDNIYGIYERIPEPRMSYLPATLRHRFLTIMAQPEKKNSKSMLRYFAVVADVKNAGLVLSLAQWNSAMSLAARYVGTSAEPEAEAALRLWREMEQDAGIKGNECTFNILFDVASKAGNFVLAEMVYNEMEARGHKFNRYHHVSLIHFFGLKQDSDGLRAAYREMVNAGEIIDTVTLNCVIAGLLRSGEEAEAERIYERMKVVDTPPINTPRRDYLTNRVVTNVLMMFARIGRGFPGLTPTFQSATSLTPNLVTYRLLVNHYAVKLGDLAKVAQYLDEMKWAQIPLHGTIFLSLFKGFAAHGGTSGSQWSEHRLVSVWKALLEALDSGVPGLEVRTWLAMWALRAFEKCSSQEMVLDVYGSLEARWALDTAQAAYMMDFLQKLLGREFLRLSD